MTPKWEGKIVSPEDVLRKIKPGMTLFIGTGMAEPKTLVKHLLSSEQSNLQDLEIMQFIRLGETVFIDERYSKKCRLKTFFSDGSPSKSAMIGHADLIPSRLYTIPRLLKSKAIQIDAVFIQISPPDDEGYACLGSNVDLTRAAMAHASLVVGEINGQMPRTFGDTFVPVEDFDYLIHSTEPPVYLARWAFDTVFDKIAAHIASVVKDGSCLSFSIGPLYEALGKHLASKRHLGIHTPFFTDALMNLVEGGSITNQHKGYCRDKSLTSCALGTEDLMKWLNRNSRVEFQAIDLVMDPRTIGRNDRFIAILPARKVDLTGNIVLHGDMNDLMAGPGIIKELSDGAALSCEGRTIFTLPSRNKRGESNIRLSVEGFPNLFSNREFFDMVVTENGVAHLTGRTVRERAQALIDIAHPDDREKLVKEAKEAKILYSDQIFLEESGRHYPEKLACTHTFEGGLTVRFRAIKPSDEYAMRRFFYHLSDKDVYYRYFRPIKTMPHARMQEYVNVDYRQIMSIVGLVDESGTERIVAEARYVRLKDRPYAEMACVVDRAFQRKGIATFLFEMLIRIAREQGIEGFTADLLADNRIMSKIREKAPYPVHSILNERIFELTMPFTESGRTEMTSEKI